MLGRVEHPDAGVDEPLERAEPLPHAVQLLVHIEAAERDVPAATGEKRLTRRHELGSDAVPATGYETQIGCA
jgi:hypothetical protein